METFGERVARLRKAKGLTQAELAHAMGRTSQGEWENDRSHPRLDSLAKLADLLGCSVEMLVTGHQAPQKRPKLVSHIAALHRAILAGTSSPALIAMVQRYGE